jgi:predicted nucleotidyltransferase
LAEILTISAGPAPLLRQELDGIAGIESAFLYGSFAARALRVAGAEPRDIDLMVVGAPDPDAVYDACTRVEEAVRRPVNPTILTRAEVTADTGFLENVRANPVIQLIGELPWP